MSESDKSKNTKDTFKRESIKRLLRDVKDIYTSSLENDGIYYKHDENDFSIGYALIIGPKDTIYQNGYYFFKFEFPYDYPHSPPKVTYYTNDGCVRFHPNFYRNGKVCLSILNTWRGEGWTSCQSIRSILLILCSVLTNDSLLNEPGITKHHKDFNTYSDIIMYKNLSVAVIAMLNETAGVYPSPHFNLFKSTVRTHFIENYKVNLDKIKKLSEKKWKSVLTTGIYNLKFTVDYKSLEEEIIKVYNRIKKDEKSCKKTDKTLNKQNEKIEIKKT